MIRDYYWLLGVEPHATMEEIRRAYRKKAAAYHPDHGGANREMVQLNEAWDVLSDPALRAEYDQLRQKAAEEMQAHPEPKQSRGFSLHDFIRRDFLRGDLVADPNSWFPISVESMSGLAFACAGTWSTCYFVPSLFGLTKTWIDGHPYYWFGVIAGALLFGVNFGAMLHRIVARNLGFLDD